MRGPLLLPTILLGQGMGGSYETPLLLCLEWGWRQIRLLLFACILFILSRASAAAATFLVRRAGQLSIPSLIPQTKHSLPLPLLCFPPCLPAFPPAHFSLPLSLPVLVISLQLLTALGPWKRHGKMTGQDRTDRAGAGADRAGKWKNWADRQGDDMTGWARTGDDRRQNRQGKTTGRPAVPHYSPNSPSCPHWTPTALRHLKNNFGHALHFAFWPSLLALVLFGLFPGFIPDRRFWEHPCSGVGRDTGGGWVGWAGVCWACQWVQTGGSLPTACSCREALPIQVPSSLPYPLQNCSPGGKYSHREHWEEGSRFRTQKAAAQTLWAGNSMVGRQGRQ